MYETKESHFGTRGDGTHSPFFQFKKALIQCIISERNCIQNKNKISKIKSKATPRHINIWPSNFSTCKVFKFI
jgi:hypothetical protein